MLWTLEMSIDAGCGVANLATCLGMCVMDAVEEYDGTFARDAMNAVCKALALADQLEFYEYLHLVGNGYETLVDIGNHGSVTCEVVADIAYRYAGFEYNPAADNPWAVCITRLPGNCYTLHLYRGED